MKQFITFSLVTLLAVAIVLPGCKKNTTPEVPSGPPFTLGLTLLNQFDNDRVILQLDGENVFDKTVTTIQTLGYAGGTSLNKPAGKHTLAVFVNNKLVKSGSFTSTKDLYIGIDYNPGTKKLTLEYRDTIYVFD